MKDIIKEFEEQFGELWIKVDDTLYKAQTGMSLQGKPIIISQEAIKSFLQKAISQTQKEAYEKGRLETIKEIEEKVNKYNSEMIAKYWKDKTETSFNVAILDIKSILNQLKDNGKY